jgi:hypothetical protein
MKFYSQNGYRDLFACVRIPGFAAKALAGVTIEQYYAGLLSGEVRERAFGVFRKCGAFPLRWVPNEFKDSESLNYGILFKLVLP